jgi:metallo-beta-lactamase family protein
MVGYQAVVTRGSYLLGGAKTIRIHGEDVPVRAQVHSVPAFSVHADRSELIDWLRATPTPPQRIVAVHGDPEAATSLAAGIEGLAPQVVIPTDGQTLVL